MRKILEKNMKKKKELKDEFELDIEFEVDKNNRVDMKQVIELISAYNKLFRTYKQLKTQLEEKENIACNWKDSCLENAGKIEILENQQKKFIEYLESEIDRLEKTEFYIDSIQKAAIETHKHNLSKYKEIIGVSDEKGTIH